ncbi:MAG TPA: EAL domain-containing protein [Longimicrobium sp.]|nr:EAL domain-containing protein [Longimicrobium sp.]
MHWQHTPYLLPLMASALLNAALGAFAWRHRSVPSARAFARLMACCAWWSLFYGLYQATTDLWAKHLFADLVQLGAIAVPVAWFVFAMRYTGRDRWLTPRGLAVTLAIPVLTALLLVTNEQHGWFWSDFDLVVRDGRIAVHTENAWGFWLHVGYSWVLHSITVGLLVLKVMRSPHLYRRQAAAIMLGALVPWVGNVLHIGRLVHFPANPMPFLFTFSGAAFAWAIFRFRFLDILPVAREAVVERMDDGVIVLDEGGRVVDLNPAARTLLGVNGTPYLGRPGREVLGPWGVLADGGSGVLSASAEVETGTDDARRRFDVRMTALSRAGTVGGRVFVLRDVSDRARAEEALRRSAFYDALTGLPNRALFLDRLEKAAARTSRGTHPFAVMFLDLDRFKLVNDSLGHHMGDELLVSVARRLEGCMRPGDTVARLGGDEFAVLLEDVEGTEVATAVADRILAVLDQPVSLEGHDVFPSASIGVVMGTEVNVPAGHLLRFADVAMYRAKARGRNRRELFDPSMHESVVARLKLEGDLRRAVDRGELRLFYQPIVELATERTAGMEALLRWQHPERGLLPPSEFIRVAEETGLIAGMGAWVAREAAGQLAAWQRELPSPEPLRMSVNVSTGELADPAFADRLAEVLREAGPLHDTLRVEVTESTMMRNADSVIPVLERLREMGVRAYMDDFGTGYSSLSWLHRFPVNVLKVDRTFVERLPREPDAVEIVRTIVALAHTLELEIIAEGVETADQASLLREMGCQYAQGFRFAGPMTAEEAGAHLAAQAVGAE